MNSAVRKLFRRASRVALLASGHIGPTGRWDAIFTGGDFVARHGRLPRHPTRADAGIMDYFFWRKHRPWRDIERESCDKGLAKQIAQRLAPEVKVPETRATIPVADLRTGAQLKAMVAPYLGRKLVMKPAHSNGGIVFMDDADMDWDAYLKYVQEDFFPIARERQYHGLVPNVIIEETLSTDGEEIPEDYKFFCVRGRPFLCQVDYDRFTGQKRQMYVVPDWLQLDVVYTYPAGDKPFPRPALLDQALEVCRKLSAPFEFVRIDLYLIGTEIFFGEFTFTPAAGTKTFSSDAFDRALGAIVRSDDFDSLLPFVCEKDWGQAGAITGIGMQNSPIDEPAKSTARL